MIFIFEDKESDLLSDLFRSAYNNCSFVYTNGNGNLEFSVRDYLDNSDDTIIVYLDTIPDNKDTINIYKTLRRISRQNDFRVIVMPVVCAEYYFINSLSRMDYRDYRGVDICLNKDDWKTSNLIEESDKKFVRNFEKYCKLILLKCVKDCIKHSRGNDNSNKVYGFYYHKDCLCNSNELDCMDISLKDKAVNYVSKYPVFPTENFLGDVKSFELDNLWEIHRSLVDDFNEFVEKYKNADSSRSYSKIDYIK